MSVERKVVMYAFSKVFIFVCLVCPVHLREFFLYSVCMSYYTRSKRSDHKEDHERSFVVVQFEDGECGIVLLNWLVSLDTSWRTSWRKAK